MNSPLLVGITGGIGSGKTTVCHVFETYHIPIYYADDRAKSLLVEDEDLKDQICQLFGSQSYAGGQLNRGYLASRVFNNEEELQRMNSVVHPAVAKDFRLFVSQHEDRPIVMKEAALLFETGSFRDLDKTIAVLAGKEERIRRVILRDQQRSQEQIEAIIDKQTSDNQRKRLADYLISNDGSQLVTSQVQLIYKELMELTS